MTKPTILPDEYTTSDLGVAAFLVARDTPLLRVDTSATRALFVFPCSAARLAPLFYQAGQNTVDGRRFHVALRDLRGLARGEHRC